MKKNLRIVSAAAAALLAVAPVAATAVVSAPASTVQADTNKVEIQSALANKKATSVGSLTAKKEQINKVLKGDTNQLNNIL